MTETPEIRKGLAGVVVDTTAISKVNSDTNSLLYRGYPVQELAAKCSFEQVAYLLWHGELPTQEQLAEFSRTERSQRTLDQNLKAVIDALPTTAHPMDVVRTAVSVMGANHPRAEDNSREANLEKALSLLAMTPAVVAYDQRRRRGEDLVQARDDLDFASNFLWMTFGEEPAPEVVDAFNVSLILYAEHSFNASTFTGRVITSTLSDLHSAITGAVGALKGALHGGANEAVMHTFAEITTAAQDSRDPGTLSAAAEKWLEQAVAEKRKIMGFGHRVYKNGDSRVPTMKGALDAMIAYYDRPDLLAIYDTLETGMAEAKNILPNLDYPAGPVYHLMGFDTLTFTPVFVAARISGWAAHVMEQNENNSLIRPLSEYVGPEQREVP